MSIAFQVASPLDIIIGRRLLYVRSQWEPGKAGPASKTGSPECSAAVSAWRKGQATPETHQQLGLCRSMAAGKRAATLQRAAGQEGRAQVLEHRVATGKVGKTRRAALAETAKHKRMAAQLRRHVGKASELAIASHEVEVDPVSAMRAIAERGREMTARAKEGRVVKLKPTTPEHKEAVKAVAGALEARYAAEMGGKRGLPEENREALWGLNKEAFKAAQGPLKATRQAETKGKVAVAEPKAESRRDVSDMEKSYREMERRAGEGDPEAIAYMASHAHDDKQREVWNRENDLAQHSLKVNQEEYSGRILDHLSDNEGKRFTAQSVADATKMTRGEARHYLDQLKAEGEIDRKTDLKTGETVYSLGEPERREPSPARAAAMAKQQAKQPAVAEPKAESVESESRGMQAGSPSVVPPRRHDELGISFVPSGASKLHKRPTVVVDVRKLDEAWKKDKGFYVGEGDEGEIAGRLAGVGQFLERAKAEGIPVEQPTINLRDNGAVSFLDGRHRFARLRDMNVTTLPVSVYPEDAKKIRDLFGAETTRSKAKLPPRFKSPSDPKEFADQVHQAAADVTGPGRFGEGKVFISDLHHAYSTRFGPIAIDEFKRKLAEANRARTLDLSRADMAPAMDPERVRRSETRQEGAEFHFVRIPKPAGEKVAPSTILDPFKEMQRRAAQLPRERMLEDLANQPNGLTAPMLRRGEGDEGILQKLVEEGRVIRHVDPISGTKYMLNRMYNLPAANVPKSLRHLTREGIEEARKAGGHRVQYGRRSA